MKEQGFGTFITINICYTIHKRDLMWGDSTVNGLSACFMGIWFVFFKKYK